MFRTALISLALTVAITGCKKSSSKAEAPPPTAKSAPVADTLGWQKLPSLGLQAEVPSSAKIDDGTANAGFPVVTIYASPTVAVTGAGDMSDLKPTLDETKTQLAKDPNKLKSWTREDKTADGWILEAARESMSGGALIGVSVRRTLGDKPYDCGTNAATRDEADRAIKMCQSLKPAS